MRILIAGGAGFLGSHLCDSLLALGHEVICIDNLSTGRWKNISHLLTPDFRFIQDDVIEPYFCNRTDIGPLDYVLHLASPASPIDYLRLPIETMKAGSIGTLNLLEMAAKKRAKFLLVSTSEVYGEPRVSPQPEEYFGNVNPIGPRAVYDEGKRFSEALTMAYHRLGLDTGIARVFNSYGPRMRLDDGRLLPSLVSKVMAGERPVLFGDGTQTRSFCYVSDTVDGLIRLMWSKEHRPVNIGSTQEIAVRYFAELVCKLMERIPEFSFAALPENDPKKRCPNISRAIHVLGWKPKVSLQDGLLATIKYFQGEQVEQKQYEEII